MSIYLAIALGGALGAMSRYWVTVTTLHWFGQSFPHATLMVNVIGSLLMGFLAWILVEAMPVGEPVRLGLLSGLLGAFTTFSAFAFETLRLFESGEITKALAYIVLSVVLCVMAAAAGLLTAKTIV